MPFGFRRSDIPRFDVDVDRGSSFKAEVTNMRPANILARPVLLNIFFPSNLCDAIPKAEPLI